MLGNGASELLWTLTRVLAGPDAKVLIAEPAFGELRAAAAALGCDVIAVRGHARAAATRSTSQLVADAARRAQRRARLPVQPDDPARRGAAHRPRSPRSRRALPDAAPVVLDESFLSLSDHAPTPRVALPPNVVRVRSLTKDHAHPRACASATRCAAPSSRARSSAARPSWTVGALAQAAAEVGGAGERAFVERSRVLLAQRPRRARRRACATLGHAPFASVAPYVAFPVGGAAALRERLLAAQPRARARLRLVRAAAT